MSQVVIFFRRKTSFPPRGEGDSAGNLIKTEISEAGGDLDVAPKDP